MIRLWRPDEWDVIEIIKELRTQLSHCRMPTITETLEAGADAMHIADIKWIEENYPDAITLIKKTSGALAWKNFSKRC